MSIDLSHNYQAGLHMAEPTFFGKETIRPPPGAQGAAHVLPMQTIPPINTNIDFTMLPSFHPAAHPGLSAMRPKELPETFNWRDGPFKDKETRRKSSLVATPGNQMLCGSCWAIAVAGTVGDNFTVSGTVDWQPNLSTTYSLACYPQQQCRGGNPALLLAAVAKGGIVSNHCLDYSWCAEDLSCNGLATKHFKHDPTSFNALIPSCGCYEDSEFFLYKIDSQENGKGPQRIFVGGKYNHDGKDETLTEESFSLIVKTQILTRGPLLGGFIVFKNFMKGGFTKTAGNKGIYFEDGVYDDTTHVKFGKKEAAPGNYVGSHAVAIIGWGIEKGVVTSKGTKDVPYWFCRNSWTEKWGDKGYFKMAAAGWNKTSQFDNQVTINSPKGRAQGGGMVIFTASQKPQKVPMKQVQEKFLQAKKAKPPDYYQKDPQKRPSPGPGPSPGGGGGLSLPSVNITYVVVGVAVALTILAVFAVGFLSGKRQKGKIRRILVPTIAVLGFLLSVSVARLLIARHCAHTCKDRSSI